MNYHIARDGQQLGSFSESAISAKLQAGELSGEDLCWGEGMAEWQPISQVLNVSTSAAAINPYAAPRVDVSRQINSSNAELASRGLRLLAQFLDGLVSLPIAVPIVYAAVTMDQQTQAFTSTGVLCLIVAGVLALILMITNLYLLSTQGQTLGKRWAKVRVVRFDDNEKAGFVKAVLLRLVVNGIISAVPFLGPFYSLVDICFIFREDRRCIHDMIAGTHVVEA